MYFQFLLVSYLITSYSNSAESLHFCFPQAAGTFRSGWMMTASYFWVMRPRRMMRVKRFGGETTLSPSTQRELERKRQRKGATASFELQEICGSEKQPAVTLTVQIQLSELLSVFTLTREFLCSSLPRSCLDGNLHIYSLLLQMSIKGMYCVPAPEPNFLAYL